MPPLELFPGNQQNYGAEEEEDSEEEEYDSDAHLWKILSGLNGTPRNSSTRTQMIGGRTTQAVEK